jgi:hypothetical protein
MAEGVAAGGKVIAGPALDDRDHEPAPDPVLAPHGYTWDRKEMRWRPKKTRGARRAPDPEPDAATAPDREGKDPDPGWMRDEGGKPDDGRKKPRIEDVPKDVVNDMAGLAGLIGAPVLAMLQSADPYCGGALAASYESVINACLPLMCRSEKLVAYFSGDKSDWLLWGKLAMALAPVGRAIIEHHVVRSVQVVKDEHGVAHVIRVARGEPGQGDHLTPPAPDYSRYAA